MEYFGILSFIFIIYFWSYPSKIEKMQKRIHKLEKKKTGGNEMSKLISELKGQVCLITTESEVTEVKCEVIDVDDEWVKCRHIDKKGELQNDMLYRIESIQKVKMVDEDKL